MSDRVTGYAVWLQLCRVPMRDNLFNMGTRRFVLDFSAQMLLSSALTTLGVAAVRALVARFVRNMTHTTRPCSSRQDAKE
jgi:hypothetical protein